MLSINKWWLDLHFWKHPNQEEHQGHHSHHRIVLAQLGLGQGTTWSGEALELVSAARTWANTSPSGRSCTRAWDWDEARAWWRACRFAGGSGRTPPRARRPEMWGPCHGTLQDPPQRCTQLHRSQQEASHRQCHQQTCQAVSQHTLWYKMIHKQFYIPQVLGRCTPFRLVYNTSWQSHCMPAAWRWSDTASQSSPRRPLPKMTDDIMSD